MRDRSPRPQPGSHEGVILFRVGGFDFAIAAGAVKEIRSMEGLREFAIGGISAQIDKLRYTLERGGATYFVVDAARHFQLPPSAPPQQAKTGLPSQLASTGQAGSPLSQLANNGQNRSPGAGASAGSRVLILRNSSTAILVDSTDRMTDISVLHALPRAFTRDERSWYRGLALVNGEVIPLVNPGAFLNKTEQEIVRQALERLQGVAMV